MAAPRFDVRMKSRLASLRAHFTLSRRAKSSAVWSCEQSSTTTTSYGDCVEARMLSRHWNRYSALLNVGITILTSGSGQDGKASRADGSARNRRSLFFQLCSSNERAEAEASRAPSPAGPSALGADGTAT